MDLRVLRRLVGALGTAVAALGVLLLLLGTAVLSLVGVGLLLAPAALRALHAVAARERRRLDLPDPRPLPVRPREAVADPPTRRELRWLAGHGTVGLLLSLLVLLLPLSALRDLTFPLWWKLVPAGEAAPTLNLWTVDDWPAALATALLGAVWLVAAVLLAPPAARMLAARGRRLLRSDADLSLRVTELTASRAAALEAHLVELRRIERALHDGAQNRLVAVTVLLGTARRAVTRDPAAADLALDRAQTAAEQALAELRGVVRSILPPVLEDRGLAGALRGLAAASPVPCWVDVDVPTRCAASVEATAYFVVAEALTNVARHSDASSVAVTVRTAGSRIQVRVTDDGRGGASPDGGTGLRGVRRRVDAHDGTLTLTSPPGGPTTLEAELPCGS
jgi:signal transduction histidine kinase